MKKTLVLAIAAGVMWASSADVRAVDYYVDGTNGNDGNPGTINQPWQTINKANSTLQAGDTVYMREGTYANQQIKPNRSGTEGNYITYVNYSGEKVIVSNRSYGYFLKNVNYIKIDGIRFADIGSYFGELKNVEYCIIQNCEFYNSRSYGGTKVGYSSNYNKFLNNTFEDAPINYGFKKTDCKSLPYGPECDCDTAPADFISIYSGKGNIIEGNYFGNASHGAINLENRPRDPWGDSKSTLSVVRNNNFNNEWHTSCGGGTQRILIENNRIYDAGSKCNENPRKGSRRRGFTGGHGAIYVLNHDSIVRYNVVVNSGWGLYYGATGGKYISGNLKIYSNTFYNNAYHIQQSGNSGANYNNNTIINNVFYKAQYREWSDYADLPGDENYFINNSFTPNAANFYFKNTNKTARTLDEIKSLYPTEWHSSNFSADPKFTNADSRDFTLKSNSPMIDKGMFLTTITSPTANSQTSFRVADAVYFYDGWGIPGEIGDTIKTKNSQITKIQSIDYDTNTITVNPAINIIKNEGIALNYSGSAPDIGAYEYNGVSPQGTVLRLIPRSRWSVIYADSEELDIREKRNAYKVFDGVIETLWSTEWLSTTAPLPHEIQIDIGESYNISGFRYLPRQDYSENAWQENGAIAQYEFYISNNKSNWGSPVADGTFAKNRTEKEVLFTSKEGRYIRLVVLSEVNGNPWTVISELNLIGEDADGCLIYEICNGKDDNCNGEIDETCNNDDWSVGYIAHSVLPQKHYQLIDVDSEELNASIPGNGFKAFDGVEETTWYTQWLLTEPDPAHPHHISIDLGKTYVVDGFRYLTPQNIAHWENGAINEYNFYVSDNKTNWGVPVFSGNFLMIQDEQEALFPGKKGRYIKLEAISGFNGNPWTSVTELTVLGHDTDSVK